MAWTLKNLFPRKVQAVPPDADACFNLGNTHVSHQQWQAALQCYREAVRLNPNHAQAHAYAGNVLRQLRDADGAMSAYDRALEVKPDYAEVHYNRGALLQQAREPSAALTCYDAALSINSSFPEAYCSRGDVLRELGRLDEAMSSYDAAITANGGYVNAYLRRATLEQQLGRPGAAEASFRKAISLEPGHAEAYHGLGTLQSSAGNHAEALMSFDIALRRLPNHARLAGNIAQALAKVGRVDEARAAHQRSVLLDPRDAALHFIHGVFLSDCKEWQNAIQSFAATIALQPDNADAYCSLGTAQHEMGQEAAALESYSQALAYNPKLATAYVNRGNLFRSRKQLTESMLDLRRALELEPDSIEANYNMGLLDLLTANFAAGWPKYELRRYIEEARAFAPRQFAQPVWSGEQSLLNKRIVLHAEQGLGDTIQFCRYASSVAALGARVILEAQAPLTELLAGLEGVSDVVSQGSPLPAADFQCSLMSLPGAFKTTLDTIPRQGAYLRADPLKIARWRELLGPSTRLRVGLTWSGNPLHSNDRNRSMALATLVPHLPGDIDFFCLQTQMSGPDRQTLGSRLNIRSVESSLKTFADTAALIETLDLVVSVDTSLAHLSGALGQRTWILVPFFPDWRWLLDRSDSPWYPTATLYRQSAAGDWEGVLAQVAADLVRIAPRSPHPVRPA